MAEPVKETPFKFDEKAFDAKIERLTKLRTEHAGKVNFNPFLWFEKVVGMQLADYKKGIRTKELYDSVMAVKEEVPTLVVVPK